MPPFPCRTEIWAVMALSPQRACISCLSSSGRTDVRAVMPLPARGINIRTVMAPLSGRTHVSVGVTMLPGRASIWTTMMTLSRGADIRAVMSASPWGADIWAVMSPSPGRAHIRCIWTCLALASDTWDVANNGGDLCPGICQCTCLQLLHLTESSFCFLRIGYDWSFCRATRSQELRASSVLAMLQHSSKYNSTIIALHMLHANLRLL